MENKKSKTKCIEANDKLEQHKEGELIILKAENQALTIENLNLRMHVCKIRKFHNWHIIQNKNGKNFEETKVELECQDCGVVIRFEGSWEYENSIAGFLNSKDLRIFDEPSYD